jgi:hypothetical protein
MKFKLSLCKKTLFGDFFATKSKIKFIQVSFVNQFYKSKIVLQKMFAKNPTVLTRRAIQTN